jgi:hypothetical protein
MTYSSAGKCHVRIKRNDEPGRRPASSYFAALVPGDSERWAGHCAPLPKLPRDVLAKLFDDYQHCIRSVDLANQRQTAYWRTSLGIRDTEKSLLLIGLDQLWRFDCLLSQEGCPDEVVLLTSNQSFAAVAAELARRRGCIVAVEPQPWWSQKLRYLRGVAGAGVYLLSLAGRIGARRPKRPRNADVIIATVSSLAQLEQPDGPRDFIFNGLPDDLIAKGLSIAMFTQLVGRTGPVSDQGRASHPYSIRIFKDLTGPIDVCVCLLRAAVARFDSPSSKSALGVDVAPLVRSDLARARWLELPSYMLLEVALRRMAASSPNAVLFHSFEGNAWESVCHDVARQYGLRTAGLQHNALLRSSLKLYRNALRPSPDVILTSGEEYTRLLISEYGYEPDRVVSAFATRRNEAKKDLLRSKSTSEVQRILVLLQGAHASSRLLAVLRDAFGGSASKTVTLRPHPAITLRAILNNGKIRIEPPFRESQETSLAADLAEHDVVVAYSSTAAMEAVGQGVPAIIVDVGDMAAGNPLFACKALNVVVDSGLALRNACDYFASMTLEEFTRQSSEARHFYEGALSARNPESVERVASVLRGGVVFSPVNCTRPID